MNKEEIFDKEPQEIFKIIPNINTYLQKINKSEYTEIKDNVFVGKNVKIDDTAVIIGPCLIEDNTTILPYCYIRENVIIGKNCHIGHAVEIKNSIILDEAQISHYNYVGDSIIGYKSHLGAGVIISNLKNDNTNIKVNNIDTHQRKLGTIIYDNVNIGSNSVIYPGTIIKQNVSIYPLTRVRGFIEENTIVKDEHTIIKKIDNII